MQADKHFFDTVRPLFAGGKLNELQVEGMTRIVDYARENEYDRGETAFMLGQIFHETAQWMQPLREGARRYGPNNYTDQQAINAVTAIYNKGIIRTNYALPAGPYGQSYYGRGLIQITWYDNYLKFENILGKPLVKNPDLALDWKIALDIAFIGCRDGVFRSKSMDDYTFPEQFEAARNIVNGDTNTNGKSTAKYSRTFYEALGGVSGDTTGAEHAPKGPSKADYKAVQQELKALNLYKGPIDGIWGKGSKAALDKYKQHRDRLEVVLKAIGE